MSVRRKIVKWLNMLDSEFDSLLVNQFDEYVPFSKFLAQSLGFKSSSALISYVRHNWTQWQFNEIIDPYPSFVEGPGGKRIYPFADPQEAAMHFTKRLKTSLGDDSDDDIVHNYIESQSGTSMAQWATTYIKSVPSNDPSHHASKDLKKRRKYGKRKYARLSRPMRNSIKAIYRAEKKRDIPDYKWDKIDFTYKNWNENNAVYFYSEVANKTDINNFLTTSPGVDFLARIDTAGVISYVQIDDFDMATVAKAAPFQNMGIYIKNLEKIITVRNNSNLECTMYAYEWVARDNLKKSVQTLFEGKYTDQWQDLTSGATATDGLPDNAYNDVRVFPGQILQLKAHYRCRKKMFYDLPPGGEVTIKHWCPAFIYYPEYFVDNPEVVYMQGLSSTLQLRFQGTLGHDSTTNTLVGFSDGQVDICVRERRVVGTSFVNFDSTFTEADQSYDAIAVGQHVPVNHPGNQVL